jgi:hypothetical protein
MMTVEQFWSRMFDLYFNMALQPELPAPDGRIFVWVRDSFGYMNPVIVHQSDVGGHADYLAIYVLEPSEYADSLGTLAIRYPPPREESK